MHKADLIWDFQQAKTEAVRHLEKMQGAAESLGWNEVAGGLEMLIVDVDNSACDELQEHEEEE